MAQRYYVAQTNPGAEQLARGELAKAGFEAVFLTRIYETAPDPVRPWRGGAQRQTPLFPGYLFITLDLAVQGWRVAASRRGVHRLLGQSPERPEPVPVGVVEGLYAAWRGGAYDERRNRVALPRVEIGQEGRLVDGHFAGRAGICEYSSAQKVLMRIGTLLVRFAPDQVVAAG